MSKRIAQRLCYLIVAFLILSFVLFFAELSVVENLKEQDVNQAPRGRAVSENVNVELTVPCPTLEAALATPLESGMTQVQIYEVLQRRKKQELRVEKGTRELWWYLRNRLNSQQTSDLSVKGNIRKQHISLQWKYEELNHISANSGPFQLNWKYWQKNISSELTKIMGKRLHYLQNPPDCRSAKKLVCRVSKSCGFGCQIHHVSYCFILAYATKRTLILDSTNWRYSPSGWDAVFKPVSSTCTEVPSDTLQFTMKSQALSVYLPPVDSLNPRPKQLPMAIPKDLASRLMSFHGAPFAWFVAQFLKHLMKPSDELGRYLNQKKAALGLNNIRPIVGLHVRRTDKKAEARYHDIEEYMVHVEEWFDRYELTHNLRSSSHRRIYIATDEPQVITEAKSRYPAYQIYSDSEISSLASKVDTRYSASSLFGLLFDVTVLSECNYIVCTFSSQVCRLAYELMQNFHVDGSQNYFSLDDVYYFGGQQAHDVIAIESHKPSSDSGHSEIPFEIGDRLGIAGNEKNGFSVGVNRRTQVNGQYPSYKVEEYIQTEEFPPYSEVV